MDIIIGVLFALIALFLVLGVTHTSFFGLFGGKCVPFLQQVIAFHPQYAYNLG